MIFKDGTPPASSLFPSTTPVRSSGATNAVFAVSLSAVSGQSVTVNFATSDGTAVAGSDYVLTNGLLTFRPGTNNQTLTLLVHGELLNETKEKYFVNLSNPTNASL